MKFKDISNKPWECACIGCAIGTNNVIPPGGIILSTTNFVLHEDPEIPIEGFLIIASKSHIKSIAELTPEESTELFNLVYNARIAQKKILGINEVTIIQEERSGHFHMWLLPRYDWMTEKFGNSLSNIRDITNYSRENLKTKDNVEKILNSVNKLKDYFNQ